MTIAPCNSSRTCSSRYCTPGCNTVAKRARAHPSRTPLHTTFLSYPSPCILAQCLVCLLYIHTPASHCIDLHPSLLSVVVSERHDRKDFCDVSKTSPHEALESSPSDDNNNLSTARSQRHDSEGTSTRATRSTTTSNNNSTTATTTTTVPTNITMTTTPPTTSAAASRTSSSAFFLVPAILVITLLVAATDAAILSVTPDGGANGSPYDLTAAMGLAGPGDTVSLADGVYDRAIVTVTDGKQGSPIVIEGSRNAVIQGDFSSRSVLVQHSWITLQVYVW